ncbi:alpha/beta hydrolase [bacterium AH-315-D21]|nr:alpha/beta hydrolase [bacterium AH-315-D21]
MTKFQEKKFSASTIEVNYAEGPDNGPPMLLIHGLGVRWTNWEPVLNQFAARWHVFALDLRGHGDSGRTPGGYGFNDYQTEVIEFLKNKIAQPAYLIGSSLGGITAADVCARAPEFVAATVLEDPPLYLAEWFDESDFAPAFREILDLVNRNLDEAGIAIELRKADEISPDDVITERAKTLVKVDPEIWASALDGRMTELWDPDAVLEAVIPPVLLMQANPDSGGALRDVEATRAIDLLSKGRYVKWEDSGHGMYREHPERFVRLVNAFFDQVLKNRQAPCPPAKLP